MWIIESSIKGVIGYYSGDAKGLLSKIQKLSNGAGSSIIELGGTFAIVCDKDTITATRMS